MADESIKVLLIEDSLFATRHMQQLLKLAARPKTVKTGIMSRTTVWGLICGIPVSFSAFFKGSIERLNLKEPVSGSPLSGALSSDTGGDLLFYVTHS